MKILKILYKFLTTANWYKTILFNFKMLPFNEAMRMPIWLYGCVDISRSTGKIYWLSNKKPHCGGWKIGQAICVLNGTNIHRDTTVVSVQGNLYLGEHGHISNGCKIFVMCGASMSLGDALYIAEHVRICCYKKISIGENFRCSWDSQILDTDFHYFMNPDRMVYPRSKMISIGNNVWIGNHSTISKDAGIGDYGIVASYSLLRDNFSHIQSGMFAGIPAVLKKSGCKRIYDSNLDEKIDEYFERNPLAKSCAIDSLGQIRDAAETGYLDNNNLVEHEANTSPRN